MMFMTSDAALQGWSYRTLRMVVGGCYPFIGGQNPSYVDNAYQYALAEIDWQARHMGANAVIGLRTIQADQFYVLVAGTAVWVDAQERIPEPTAIEMAHGWPVHMWDFVVRLTQYL